MYKTKLTFVSPASLKMPKEVIDECKELGVVPNQTSNLEKAIKSILTQTFQDFDAGT